MVKNLLTSAGDVRYLSSIPDREDPLEKEMATHSNILAWEIPWTEEPGGLQVRVTKKIRHDLVTINSNNN